MRNYWMFLMLLMYISCKNEMSPPNLESNAKPSKGFVDFDGVSDKFRESSVSFVEQKFKEFYDLNVLLLEYPDFKTDIEQRIKNFTAGEEDIFDRTSSFKVVNIRQKGAVVKVSDSLESIKVLFDVVTENETKTDSVTALISKKTIQIEGDSVISKKINFSKAMLLKFEQP